MLSWRRKKRFKTCWVSDRVTVLDSFQHFLYLNVLQIRLSDKETSLGYNGLTWCNKKTQFHCSCEPKCREEQKASMCRGLGHDIATSSSLSFLTFLPFSLSLSFSPKLSPVLKTSSRTGLRSAAGVPKQTQGAQRECAVSQRDSLDPCGVYSRKPPVTFRYDTSLHHTFPLKSSHVFSVTQ